MKKKMLIVALGAIVLTCDDGNPIACEYGKGDDYEIYEMVMKKEFGNSDYLIVLRDTTVSERIDTFHVNKLKERIPELLSETIDNYKIANITSMKLKRIRNGEHIIFQNEYSSSQKEIINVWLSKVGYSSNMSQAIVTIGTIFGPKAADGRLIFFQKQNDTWYIKGEYLIWRS